MVVDGLTERMVTTPAEMLSLLAQGDAARRTGRTDFNAHSSRSHSVFTIVRIIMTLAARPLLKRAQTIESRDVSTGDESIAPFVRLSQLVSLAAATRDFRECSPDDFAEPDRSRWQRRRDIAVGATAGRQAHQQEVRAES
jgi:hypothetical protein